jgi:hypothetical protein
MLAITSQTHGAAVACTECRDAVVDACCSIACVALRLGCELPVANICIVIFAQIYVALPLVLYVAERVWRLVRNIAFRGELLDVELLPGSGQPPKPSSSVTVLRMRKPRDFSYRFLCIDAARNVLN